MSMRDETPDQPALSERSESNGIDALIDDAARRLVAGEPSSALRSSVRDRIGARRPAWSFVPALAGAVVLLVVAVLVGRGPVGRTLLGPGGADRVRPPDERPGIERAAAPALQLDEPAAIQPAPIPARQFTRRVAKVISPPAEEEESLIPPIAIEPLKTVPLDVQIAVDVSSGVMPIDIAPLQIEPLLGQ